MTGVKALLVVLTFRGGGASHTVRGWRGGSAVLVEGAGEPLRMTWGSLRKGEGAV